MCRILATVVTYNAMEWVERCLGSLRGSSLRPDVLVVDNGSSDGTQDYIRRHFPEAELVCRDDNPGFGAANNIGLRLALERGYDFVYLLNQDAWVLPDTLRLLVDAVRPGYGILSPVQRDAEGRLDRQFGRKCGRRLKAAASKMSAASGKSAARIPAAQTGLEAASAPASSAIPGAESSPGVVEVPFVMAAHWLLSAETIRRVGGFSPAFRQYGEDDNYIDRLHYCGLRCAVVPAAAAVHDRADRLTPRERRIKLKCIAVTVRLSDPRRAFALRALLSPLELIGMSVKNLSLSPLRYIPVLRRCLPELRRLRRASRERGAFLTPPPSGS